MSAGDAERGAAAAGGAGRADGGQRLPGGDEILDQQLGYEVARYLFGPAAERRRRVSDDPQIGRAAELLAPGDHAERAAGPGERGPPPALTDPRRGRRTAPRTGRCCRAPAGWPAPSTASASASRPGAPVISSRRGIPSARSSHSTAFSNGRSGTAGTSSTTSIERPPTTSAARTTACTARPAGPAATPACCSRRPGRRSAPPSGSPGPEWCWGCRPRPMRPSMMTASPGGSVKRMASLSGPAWTSVPRLSALSIMGLSITCTKSAVRLVSER